MEHAEISYLRQGFPSAYPSTLLLRRHFAFSERVRGIAVAFHIASSFYSQSDWQPLRQVTSTKVCARPPNEHRSISAPTAILQSVANCFECYYWGQLQILSILGVVSSVGLQYYAFSHEYKQFLQIFPLNVPSNETMVISLDNVAERLEIERRRLYDIINMLESLQMARKVAKNSYRWFGCQKLHVTLAHLKVLALKLGLQEQVQNIQTRSNRCAFDNYSENNEPQSRIKSAETDKNVGRLERHMPDGPIVQFIITDEDADGDGSVTTLNVDVVKKKFEPVANSALENCDTEPSDLVFTEFSKILPKIKSLGMLCQSFLMIFLVSNKSYPVTLDNISRILGLPSTCEVDADTVSSTADAYPKDSAISHKTKLRRLYDIANVLSSLHIICKIKRFELTKKPLFKYTGPHVEVGEILHSAKINFSNVSRHSLLGSDDLDASNNETVLELKLQSENHPQWIVSSLTVDESTQHKRKLQNRNSETTPKLLRTRSNDVLYRKKKNADCRYETSKFCLDGILNIAEMELQRLQSMEDKSSQSESPEKRKCGNRDEQPTAARRRLFSRHHSEPCINVNESVNGNKVQVSQKPAELLCDQTSASVSCRNQTDHGVQQVGVNASTTDEMNAVLTIECSEFGNKHLEQRVKEPEKQCTLIPTQSGQKLKIVRRFERLTSTPMSARSVFVKTYTCRPVQVLPICSSNATLSKSENETSTSSASLDTVLQEGFTKTSTVVTNLSHLATFKDVDYSKLPKFKLVKVGEIATLIPLCSSNDNPQ